MKITDYKIPENIPDYREEKTLVAGKFLFVLQYIQKHRPTKWKSIHDALLAEFGSSSNYSTIQSWLNAIAEHGFERVLEAKRHGFHGIDINSWEPFTLNVSVDLLSKFAEKEENAFVKDVLTKLWLLKSGQISNRTQLRDRHGVQPATSRGWIEDINEKVGQLGEEKGLESFVKEKRSQQTLLIGGRDPSNGLEYPFRLWNSQFEQIGEYRKIHDFQRSETLMESTRRIILIGLSNVEASEEAPREVEGSGYGNISRLFFQSEDASRIEAIRGRSPGTSDTKLIRFLVDVAFKKE
ncbi:MAG: hypothetical protein AAFU78_19065 [Cyanobacteria bacterium J06633_2]